MGTVSNALSLLGFFNLQRPEIGLSDLARLSGMNKATVYRHMSELALRGFVEKSHGGTSYRLGPEVLRLASLREAAVPLLSVAREMLARLSAATHETSHMSVVQGMRLNAIAHHYSTRHGTRVTMEDAEVLSFHGTASGLAILAFSEAAFVDAVLARPLPVHTPHTETDPDRIRARLRGIRASGVAQSVGGFEADVHSLAVPIFGPDRCPTGALAVAVPVARMSDALARRAQAELTACAADLTRRIGGFAPETLPLQDTSARSEMTG
ncbi:IclR family transcriptional regulator [Aestuariivita sp.]|jgi:DNA-binding IclR family transcriptional regulator|uniref:IclR family transcriptional regulator n=1 Tax=Aestuariivita sp. TaxID=1872407 RepID=UPI00216C4433|nr:IclR family transcriptional regulator [Aestuariivita sp.]MCE8009243.1 IclR family transcriptional regulator [Aestuariivita sp.]